MSWNLKHFFTNVKYWIICLSLWNYFYYFFENFGKVSSIFVGIKLSTTLLLYVIRLILSIFRNHRPAILASSSLINASQPYSLELFTHQTKVTTVSLGVALSVPTSWSSLHKPTMQNKLDLDMVDVLSQGVLLVLLQALLLVGAESPAHLHWVSPVMAAPTHLEVLMTLPVWIAPTLLAQKMLYLLKDLLPILYHLS
jgi:hypothetical protein